MSKFKRIATALLALAFCIGLMNTAFAYDTISTVYSDDFQTFIRWTRANGNDSALTEGTDPVTQNKFTTVTCDGTANIFRKDLALPSVKPSSIISWEFDFKADGYTYPNTGNTDKRLFLGDTSSGRIPVYYLYIGRNGNVYCGIGGNNPPASITVAEAYDQSKWHHIKTVLNYDTKEFKIYFNDNPPITHTVTGDLNEFARAYVDVRGNNGYISFDNMLLQYVDEECAEIEVAGDTNVEIEAGEGKDIQYSAVLKDAGGNVLTANRTISWEITEPKILPTGVAFDTSSGKLSVAAVAEDFDLDFTIKATSAYTQTVSGEFVARIRKKFVEPDVIAAQVIQNVKLKTYDADNNIVEIDTDNPDIRNDLVLDLDGEAGTTLSWTSMNKTLLSDTGEVTIPGADTLVKLKLVVTKVDAKNNLTGTAEKTFSLTIKNTTNVRDVQAVRYDKKIAANYLSALGSTLGSNLTLPTATNYGSNIEWHSSNVLVLFNDGKVSRAAEDKTVTLKAIITKGAASEIVEKMLTINGTGTSKQSTSSSKSSGGGSGTVVFPTSIQITASTSVADEEVYTEADLFSDIENVSWAKTAITELGNKEIITGKEPGKFFPEDNISRAEFIKILVKAFNFDDETAECDFTDVVEEDWYYNYIAAALKNGLISGYTDDTFKPNNNITREEMAVVISKLLHKIHANISIDTDILQYSDKDDISSYALESVAAVTTLGIMGGMGNNMFSPKETTNRAQAAKVIYETLIRK